MPTAATGKKVYSNRAPTPSSAFCPGVNKIKPPVYNKDIDEELLKKAKADSLHIMRAATREKRKNTCFATVTENTAAAAQWRSNSVARVGHDEERMNRYLHTFVPVGAQHPNSSGHYDNNASHGGNNNNNTNLEEAMMKLRRNKLTNSFDISYQEPTTSSISSVSHQRHAGITKIVAPAKKVTIKPNEPALTQIFRQATATTDHQHNNNTSPSSMMDDFHHNNNNSSSVHPSNNDLSRISAVVGNSNNNNSNHQNQSYYSSQLFRRGASTPQPHQNNKNNNNNNSKNRPNSSLSTYTHASSQNTYEVTGLVEDADYFENEIDSFEDKLAQLRREEKEREEEDKQQLRMGLMKAPSNAATALNNNNNNNKKNSSGSQLMKKRSGSTTNTTSGGLLATSSSATTTSIRKHSTSDCAPFALPKVLQMLFRLLLSRKLSATAALRAVGFPELRSRLTAAAEGGMLKRHAFEAIFLDCLRTDQERLEHAAVIDCFLLDAGGDAELAFVLIALQVLLGIASAADVMRYCFYLLDTSSRVPRYLTRLELEALLREADSAAQDNPASKDDTEYQSMRMAVLRILDPASELFDGKGRMPLSGFLERLRMAMNELNNNNNNNQNNSNSNKKNDNSTNDDVVEKTISLQNQKYKKRAQQQQQLDGLASKHDLFHHSTSRRIVLQTAPEELVKET